MNRLGYCWHKTSILVELILLLLMLQKNAEAMQKQDKSFDITYLGSLTTRDYRDKKPTDLMMRFSKISLTDKEDLSNGLQVLFHDPFQ
jgi:hypothetical protein